MNGYDIDGVLTIGMLPYKGDVIITGRSFEEAPETYHFLFRKGIFNAVYFNPKTFDQKTKLNSGAWKASIINLLGVEKFFEDDQIQADKIEELAPNVFIQLVE